MAERPLRLGIIGVGNISQLAHLPAAEMADQVHVVALADTRRELLAMVADRHHIGRTYGSAEDILGDEEIEAVDLCVPAIAHKQLSILALRAGKHVLCEKPMACSVSQCRQMVSAERQTGRRLMIGHHKRYDPGCEQAREAVTAGQIGAPRLVIYHFGTGNWTAPAPRPALVSSEPAPPWDYAFPPGIQEPSHRAYFVSLLEMFTHMTNLIRWLVGDPHWILAAQPASNVVRGCLALGWGEDGGEAQAFCVDGPHYAANVWNEVLAIWGDDGRIEVTLPQNVFMNKAARVRLFSAKTGADTLLPEVYGWAFARELDYFASAIRTGQAFRTPAEDSLKDIVVCEAAVRAAAGLSALPARIEFDAAEQES